MTKEEMLRRVAELEKYVNEERKAWEEKLNNALDEISRMNEEMAGKDKQLMVARAKAESLERQSEALSKLKEALKELMPETSYDITKLVRGEVEKALQSGELTVQKNEYDVLVDTKRETAVTDESTLRGQIALLIADGEIGEDGLTTRTIAKKIRELGYPAPAQGLTEELMWFVRNRILDHVERPDGSHVYRVRDKSRVKERVNKT